MIEKKLRLQQLERDLQSLIERAIAYEWQTYVESMKTVPASGRPERVKIKFFLTFSVGVVMMVSVTSRTNSVYLSDDAYSSVKIGLCQNRRLMQHQKYEGYFRVVKPWRLKWLYQLRAAAQYLGDFGKLRG